MARWLPLESNPTVMNHFIKEVGAEGKLTAVDVYGLETDLLAFVPQPVLSVILLYPLTENAENFRAQQESGISAAGQEVSDKVFFMKQYVGNACGTVALVHSLINLQDHLQLTEGPLHTFFEKCKDMSPEERGKEFENSTAIANIHDKLAKEGQSATPSVEEKMEPHFISLVNVDGSLYELDGRKPFPINHGPTSEFSFLQDAANICRNFMDVDPEDSRFAIMALVNSPIV